MNSDSKQLHYSDRTFDIIPNVVIPRNFNLERGVFNQASEIEYKNPVKHEEIRKKMSSNSLNNYKNPYAISQFEFSDNSISRKADKQNRTNIFDQRLSAKSKYLHQLKQGPNKVAERFSQLDQNNPNSSKYKQVHNTNKVSFQEYLNFKRKMAQHDGTRKI